MSKNIIQWMLSPGEICPLRISKLMAPTHTTPIGSEISNLVTSNLMSDYKTHEQFSPSKDLPVMTNNKVEELIRDIEFSIEEDKFDTELSTIPIIAIDSI